MKSESLAGRFRQFILFLLVSGLAASPAFALSEIKREEIPPPQMLPPSKPGSGQTVPVPEMTEPDSKTPADDTQVPDGQAEPAGAIPEIQHDLSRLPAAVQKTRQALIDAAKSGDVEKLRPLLAAGANPTQLALGGISGDPIAYIKGLAGDEGGQEILAIMEEILSAGYVHMEAGGTEEFYAWPYFFAVPLDKLTAPQRVELFKIITAGDLEDMQTYGAYSFYRLGIRPDGSWAFFLAGD